MAIFLGTGGLYFIIYNYRDQIPKSVHVLANTLGWIYFRLLLPWTNLVVGLLVVPGIELNFLEELIGYVVVILLTVLLFKISDPLLLFRLIRQPMDSPASWPR